MVSCGRKMVDTETCAEGFGEFIDELTAPVSNPGGWDPVVTNAALANNSGSFLSYKALKRGRFEVYYLSIGVNHHYNIIITFTGRW